MIGVVDTSVVVKWYATEADSVLAERLIRAELVAPDLILVELGQTLWKKQRDKELLATQARNGLAHLSDTVVLFSSDVLAAPALDRAIELSHPVSDCVFLVLAEQLQLPLITSDHKFAKRCVGSRYEHFVVTLTDWSMSG